MERLDELDRSVLERLGYAVARAQLFELALLKLLEAQRHDLEIPLEDRWAEIQTWLTKKTAGVAARDLKLPETVAADLKVVVAARNVVAHHVWRFYLAARERQGPDAAEVYVRWLDNQARILGTAYNATFALVERARAGILRQEQVEQAWRSHFEAPLTELAPPATD